VAQTGLIVKEMGPERSRINVPDPIYIFFQPNQMSQVQRMCCFQKWGLSRTDPILDRKWGRSSADPILLSSLIGQRKRNGIEDGTLKRATCGPTIRLGFHNLFETRYRRCGPLILKAHPWRLQDILAQACTEGNALDILFVCMAPTHRSQGILRGGGLSSDVCRACGGPPGAHVEAGRGSRGDTGG